MASFCDRLPVETELQAGICLHLLNCVPSSESIGIPNSVDFHVSFWLLEAPKYRMKTYFSDE